ncbi:MAG: polynucleotide adenylyltransferase PcnB [Planctomycetes bacterium]|nr:polynucleotide adenylyltransferase PcnB [Planctomycetota bacterium]
MIKKVVKMVSKLRAKSKGEPTDNETDPNKITHTGKKPVIRTRAQHAISRKNISEHALKVLSRLQSSGHIAYLVGGSVRDLLLGINPKDFDVSTDAHPQQIKRLFRNCWLIGRRFRLAHIKFGGTIIETSTFRKIPLQAAENGEPDEDLLVRDDNTFGTPEEDAFRRDFTINGLFYDLSTFSVIDYVGGLKDLDKKLIHSIGDPQIRFREDPIRMLRAVRFATRLNFKLEKKTHQAILDLAEEITKAAPARLVEEFYKFFSYGAGEEAIKLLHDLGLLQHVIPTLDEYLGTADKQGQERYWSYLRKFDQGNKHKYSVDLPMAFSLLLYPLIYDQAVATEGEHLRLSHSAHEILEGIVKTLIVPRRIRESIGLIFSAQDRFMAKRKRRFNRQKFMSRRFFADALELYGLAVEIESLDPEPLQKWRHLYNEFKKSGGVEEAESDPRNRQPKRRSPRSHRGRRRPEKVQVEEGQAEEPKKTQPKKLEEKPSGKPRKRRPRRRGGRRREAGTLTAMPNPPASKPDIMVTGKEGQEPTHWMDEI